MPIYNKLVRDKVAQSVEDSGQRPIVRILEDHEYVLALALKLQEEWGEFLAVPSVEELADVLEVVRAVAAAYGLSWSDVEHARITKREQVGGFDERRFLERVEP